MADSGQMGTPATSDELVQKLRRAIQDAAPQRDGQLYQWEADLIIAAVRPLIEAAERRRIVANLWKYGNVPASVVARAIGDSPETEPPNAQ